MRGTIGSDRTLPLDLDTLQYFKGRGVSVEGRLFEDLLEDELLGILDAISAWLTPDNRRRLDETVAFGSAATHEPNACAMPCLDGYAVLFDYSFDTLLISATELHHALMLPPKTLSGDTFPLALNTAIISVFFNVADYWSPISDDFAHREVTGSWIWLMSVFLLAHELGHVMLNHLDGAGTRDAIFRSHASTDRVTVLQPAHDEEFAADQYAIELMFQGEKLGGLMAPGADRISFWSSAYVTLGWLFSVFSAIETLARRLEIPIPDTHPPAGERWTRIDTRIRDRISINPSMIKFLSFMRSQILNSAQSGDLPTIRKERLSEIDSYVAVPYYTSLNQSTDNVGGRGQSQWIAPASEVFMAWINAATLEAAKDILRQHPELLDPKVDAMHDELANDQRYDYGRAHILRKRLPLLQRSREVGIDEAFAESARGDLRLPGEPNQGFDIPIATLQLYQTALAEKDAQRMKDLEASCPVLATFLKLPDTVTLLANTRTPEDTLQMLQTQPELLHPTADKIFADLADHQSNEAAWKKVQGFRIIIARCREFGIFLANVRAPALPLPSRIVLEVEEDSGSMSLWAGYWTDPLAKRSGRTALLTPTWPVEPFIGRSLDVCADRDPRQEPPVAFGTSEGFLWCIPSLLG